MNNIPEVKVGIVAVSRDCFPESLSVNRRKALVDAYSKKYDARDIYECPVCIVESEDPYGPGAGGYQESRMQRAGRIPGKFRTGDFRAHCWQSILTVRKCLLPQQRRVKTTWIQERGDAYCGIAERKL